MTAPFFRGSFFEAQAQARVGIGDFNFISVQARDMQRLFMFHDGCSAQ